MKSLKDFNYLLSLDRRYTKTESEIFRHMPLPVTLALNIHRRPAADAGSLAAPF